MDCLEWYFTYKNDLKITRYFYPEYKTEEKSFEEVEAQIKDMLVNQKRNEAYQSLLEELRESATIVILDPVIKAYEKAQEEAQSQEGEGYTPAPDMTEEEPAPTE